MCPTRIFKGKIFLPESKDYYIISIDNKNVEIYLNLARAYEAEFSNLTGKLPNEFGIFEPDTMPSSPYIGYLLFKNNIPVGFCLAEINLNLRDIAEFYIIPSARKNNLGLILASIIFEMYPGNWQVRQIQGADKATAFWRKVISKQTDNKYTEAVVNDPIWGIVTRQQFVIDGLKKNDNKASIQKIKPESIPAIDVINKKPLNIFFTSVGNSRVGDVESCSDSSNLKKSI